MSVCKTKTIDLDQCFGPEGVIGRIQLETGPSVDEYLLHSGAAAAATECGAILLHSAVLQGPPEIRDSVFLHEVGHVLQFNNPAAQPDERAENEAWQAAASLARGELPTVRYRPLRSVAFVRAIFMARDAQEYYSAYPSEPSGRGSFLQVTSPGYMLGGGAVNLEGLLQAISSTGVAGQDLLVVVHGAEDGLGLPVVAGCENPRANTEFLNSLNDASNDADLARRWRQSYQGGAASFDAAAIGRLRTLRDAVRLLHLNTFHFRGCSIGSDVGNLNALRNFLGCQAVSATSVSNVYGGSSLLHVNEHGRVQTPIRRDVEISAGNNADVRLEGNRFHVYVQTDADYDRFRQRVFGATSGGRRQRPWHLMSGRNRSEFMIFPTDEAYSSHLVWSA